jgi:hypothetical protein
MLYLQVVDREEPHFSNYRGCRHAKEEMLKEKVTESTQDYHRKGVLFQPHHPRTVFHGGATQQQQQPQLLLVAQACPSSLEAQPASTKSVSSGS